MKKLFFLFISVLLFLTSCQLFENDVEDFMEKYTETAAIEVHEINANTYEDSLEQLCVASEEDVEINFYMRNPKKFMMVPSVAFNNLNSKLSRSAVSIEQTSTEIVNLKLPQDFLIPADEGQDITLEINLYEPMSGREFDIYTVPLHCNTVPPLILNPTILNKNDQKFVIAFDMPNEEDVAIRHKDLSEVVINGTSYPVKVSTEPSNEIEGVMVAVYTFSDSHFTRSEQASPYIRIGGKDFSENRNSVFFETDDAFVAGDKEYTLILKDKAGLSSTVKASTSISKLAKPVIMDQSDSAISEGGLTGIPFDENTEKGKITIIPPTKDHHGDSVSGATVHYKVYEATGSGRIYTSGTTTEAKTIELPQNTYRVEAYATLTNYENSATTTVKFRFLNNVIFVQQGFVGGDGSEAAPFGSVAEALTSINDQDRKRQSKYTIYMDGSFDEIVEIDNTLNTDEVVLATNPRANISSTASVKSIRINDNMPSSFKLGVNKLVINNPTSEGVLIGNNSPVTISLTDVTISTNSARCAIRVGSDSAAKLTCTNVNITGFTQAIDLGVADLTFNSGTITGINSAADAWAIKVASRLIFNGGTITNSGIGILAPDGQVEIKGGSLSHNQTGLKLSNNAKVTVSGGSISGNTTGIIYDGGELTVSGGKIENNEQGVYVNADNFKVSGSPVIQNNQDTATTPVKQNVVLNSGKNIQFAGALKSGAKIGVTTDSNRQPADIGQMFTFASGYTYSDSPSKYFVSDQGYSIVKDGTFVKVAKSGSSGGFYNADAYVFKFTICSSMAAPNETKAVTITPAVIRKEADGTEKELTYSSADRELYLNGEKINPGKTVDWSIIIMSGNTPAASFTTNSFTFPALPPYPYKILVIANYMGIPHDAEFDFNVVNPEVSVNGSSFNGTRITTSRVFINNRNLTIRPLIVSIHEVTQGEYQEYCYFVANNKPNESNGLGDEYPVYYVSWYDAIVYCNLKTINDPELGLDHCAYSLAGNKDPRTWDVLSRIGDQYCITSTNYTLLNSIAFDENADGWRLPTEVEWEYLARGGNLTNSDQTQYSGTNVQNLLKNYAWYIENSGDAGGTNNKKSHKVCTKAPNGLGLYDMSGNVYEWCWDYYQTTINDFTPSIGPNSGEERVCRGGCWDSPANNCEVSNINWFTPETRNFAIGFRLVRNAE